MRLQPRRSHPDAHADADADARTHAHAGPHARACADARTHAHAGPHARACTGAHADPHARACTDSDPTPDPTPAAIPTPTPSPGPDTARPSFVRLTGTSDVRAGRGREIGATVADNRALRRLKVWVDGRLVRTWSPGGTRATRSVYVPASRLWHGRHTVRWKVRDAAGNVRTVTFRLYVR